MANTEPAPANRLRRLECLRGAAALYVFFHHYAHVVISPHHPQIARLFKFGQFAVLLFFVVSGFVIYYATLGPALAPDAQPPSLHARGTGLKFRGYFIRRFRRIYPPFLLVLVLTYLVQCLIDGGLADPRWTELAGNVAMLQDENVHAWFKPYLTNASLWSLSYEWAFYMLFFALLLLTLRPGEDRHGPQTRRRQLAIVGGLAIVGFAVHRIWPTQISLFAMYMPIWWTGAEFAREYLRTGSVSVRAQLVPLGLVALVACLWVVPVYELWRSGGELSVWKHPVFELRHFVTTVIILIGGLAWNAIGWRGFYAVLGPFERIAPISYGLYIVHKPFMHLAAERSPLGNPWLELLWLIPVVWALSWLIERGIHDTVVRWLR
jgi:peptidoglycan/LPS O-acetylase OafA/YrhL